MDSTILHRRPAVLLVLFLSVGILLARYLTFEPVVVVSTGLALLFCTFAAVCLRGHKFLIDVFLVLLIVVCGLSLQSYQRDSFDSKKLIPVEENELVMFEGEVVEEPSIRTNRVQIVLAVRTLSRVEIQQHVERRVIIHGKPDVLGPHLDRLTIGTTMTGSGILEDYPRQHNPGEFDYGRYLELNGIHGIIVVKDSSEISFPNFTGAAGWWMFPQKLRSSLLQKIDDLHSDQVASFLRGILLADRSKIPADVRQSFVETGTVHVLAVSGLHVGVVALMFYAAFGLFRLPRKLVVLATMVGLVFYMLLVGAPPSVARATVMALVLLMGMLLERKVDVYQSLGIAALILLLWDSNNLFNVGFQLSFAAVISIVYFFPRLTNILQRLPERLREQTILKAGLQLFAVSLAAQIGTLPFTAYYFDQVSLASLLTNVFVVPVVALNVTLGFTTLLLSTISLWLAQTYAVLNDLLVSWLLFAVNYASRVPYAAINTAQLDATFPLLYYAGIAGITHVRDTRVIKALMFFALVYANVTVYSGIVRESDAKLRITFLDVWQGDAILMEFPSGKHILLDAGGRSETFDSGERTIAPFLRYEGISSLDALIMSHPHSDHIGGVPYLLDHFEVRQLIEPTVGGGSATYQEIHQKALEHAIPMKKYEAGTRIDLDKTARLYVLHPYLQRDERESLNNASLVIKLVYGSNEVLLVGDIEKSLEEKLLARYPSMLPSTLLKVGHHGSSTSSSREFVGAVQPHVAVILSGKNNKFGHPSPNVLQTLRKQGIEIHRTDKEGAIIFESDGASLNTVQWRDE